jgi:hypothetical protein
VTPLSTSELRITGPGQCGNVTRDRCGASGRYRGASARHQTRVEGPRGPSTSTTG